MSTEQRTHHTNSASSLQSKAACPGFQGRKSENEHSIAGTLCHKAVEDGVLDGLTEEQAIAVQTCIDWRNGKIQQFQSENPGKCTILVEEPLEIDERVQPTGEGCTSGGFLDFAIVNESGTRARLMDWKFVSWEVEPVETNLQFWTYVLGLRKLYPKLKSIAVDCVCPYLGVVDSHEFHEEDFERLYLGILATVERTKCPENELRPMWPNCSFCANIGRCAAVAKLYIPVARKFSPLTIPDNATEIMSIEDSTPEQASLLMKVADVAKTWAEAVRVEINNLAILHGKEVEGYQLVTSTERTIKDPRKLEAIAKRFIPATRWSECFTIYLTKIEKAIQECSQPRQGASNKRAFDEAARAEGALEDGGTKTYLRMKRQTLED